MGRREWEKIERQRQFSVIFSTFAATTEIWSFFIVSLEKKGKFDFFFRIRNRMASNQVDSISNPIKLCRREKKQHSIRNDSIAVLDLADSSSCFLPCSNPLAQYDGLSELLLSQNAKTVLVTRKSYFRGHFFHMSTFFILDPYWNSYLLLRPSARSLFHLASPFHFLPSPLP